MHTLYNLTPALIPPVISQEETGINEEEENKNARQAPSLKKAPEIDPRGPLLRHKKDEWFLKGPVPFSWLTTAGKLPGKALHVGMMIWLYAGFNNQRHLRFPLSRVQPTVIDRYAASRGLQELEKAGLISLSHKPGQSYVVTILGAPKGSILRPNKCSKNFDEMA